MLESLKYVVTFNTTGRTLKNQIYFKPGLTVVQGENESGKSFVFEMIRYALFGSAALRGDLKDYDKLEVDLDLVIKEKRYSISRKGNKASVNKNEAIGTTAVNKYILKVLGFGLSVFDMSNNVNQGELDKLTKDMGPTERRRIIDEVTGLNQFEKAEKDCRQKANDLKKISDALEAQLVEPIAPVQPDSYQPSEVLKVRLDQEIRNQAIRDSFEEREKPSEPEAPSGSADSVAHEQARQQWLLRESELLQKLSELPEIQGDYSEEEIKQFSESLSQEERGPRPEGYSEDDLSQWRSDHAIRERESDPLYCGECGAIVSGKELPSEPPLSVSEIAEELSRQAQWKGHTYNGGLVKSPLSRSDIDTRLAAFSSQAERRFIEGQLKELGQEPEDLSEEASNWLQFEKDQEKYSSDCEAYQKYLEKKQIVDALPSPEPFLRESYEMSLRYETLLSKYETTKDIYETQEQKLNQAKKQHEEYKKGSAAVRDARKEVKRYLVPSLSKVSSQLLAEMTDGERRHIHIDENFDIWVDKQPVRTLSGSGVSVANLALRVALGQVLTQSVLPIMLADEIDANMAEKRTKATHDSLKKLRSKLKQIVVITHKELEGDHTIWLKT